MTFDYVMHTSISQKRQGLYIKAWKKKKPQNPKTKQIKNTQKKKPTHLACIAGICQNQDKQIADDWEKCVTINSFNKKWFSIYFPTEKPEIMFCLLIEMLQCSSVPLLRITRLDILMEVLTNWWAWHRIIISVLQPVAVCCFVRSGLYVLLISLCSVWYGCLEVVLVL